jgi:hypothetical protein
MPCHVRGSDEQRVDADDPDEREDAGPGVHQQKYAERNRQETDGANQPDRGGVSPDCGSSGDFRHPNDEGAKRNEHQEHDFRDPWPEERQDPHGHGHRSGDRRHASRWITPSHLRAHRENGAPSTSANAPNSRISIARLIAGIAPMTASTAPA